MLKCCWIHHILYQSMSDFSEIVTCFLTMFFAYIVVDQIMEGWKQNNNHECQVVVLHRCSQAIVDQIATDLYLTSEEEEQEEDQEKQDQEQNENNKQTNQNENDEEINETIHNENEKDKLE